MSDTPVPGFFAVATERSVVLRAVRIALVVGVVIALINHGDKMVTMTMTGSTFWKIALTFLVPYCVSTYAAVQTIRRAAAEKGS